MVILSDQRYWVEHTFNIEELNARSLYREIRPKSNRTWKMTYFENFTYSMLPLYPTQLKPSTAKLPAMHDFAAPSLVSE